MQGTSYKPSRYSKKSRPAENPFCPYCKQRTFSIKSKNGEKIKVNLKPVYYIPNPNGYDEFISPKGIRRRGNIAHDGCMGYTEHVCRR